MSFDSFYGGRQGASFVIVYQFDGIDIPQNAGSYVYKIKHYAITSDGFLIYNNGFIERNSANYLQYNWKYVALDGTDVITKKFEGDTTTYTITKPAKLAEGMRQCFEKGGDSTNQVNYGEYVMIISANENDPDNGKVYRRGMNFDYNPETNPLAGAIYVGQVRGPKGEVTKVDFDHYESIWNQYHDSNNPSERGWYEYDFSINTYAVSNDIVVNITKSYYDVEANVAVIPPDVTNPHDAGYYERSGEEPYYSYTLTEDETIDETKTYYIVNSHKIEYSNSHFPVVVDEYTPREGDIIPGYYLDEEGHPQYEDNIKYIYAQFVDEYGQAEGTVIGFKLPTLVQEFEARSMSPYQQRKTDPETGRYYNDELVYEDPEQYVDNKWKHPFYQKWQMKIPNGYHGTNSTNIEIIHTKTKPEGYEDYIDYDVLFDYDSVNDVYTVATDVDSTIEKTYWTLVVNSKNFSWPLTPAQREINPKIEGYYERADTRFFITTDEQIDTNKTYYVITATEKVVKRHYAGAPVYDDPSCTQPHMVDGSPLILTISVDILKEEEGKDGKIYRYFTWTDDEGIEHEPDHYIYNACDSSLDDYNSCRVLYENEILFVKKEDCCKDVIRYRETDYSNYGDDTDIYGNEIGEVKYYYLGEYNEILKVTLSENGTLTVFYTGAENASFEQAIRWIDTKNTDGITLDDHGTLKMYYNTLDENGEHEKEEWYQKLQWIDTKNADGITFDDHGTVTVFYNTLDEEGNHNKEEWIQKIKWIYDENDGITFDDDGTVSIYFNTLDDNGDRNKKVWNQLIKWIYDENEGITFDDNGTVTIYFNTFHEEDDPEHPGQKIRVRNKHVWEQLIRWIDDKNADGITFDDDGTITVYYNTTHEEQDPETGEVTVVHDKEQWEQKIQWIDKKNTEGITIDDQGTIKIFYNTFHEVEDPETGEKRKERDVDEWYQKLQWIDTKNAEGITFDDNGTVRVFYNTLNDQGEHNKEEWLQKIRWIDKKDTSGITFDDDGTITVYYNTTHEEQDPISGETITVHDKDRWDQKIRWIDTKDTDGITFDEHGTVKVFYNTFHETEDPETHLPTKERDVDEWYQQIRWIEKGTNPSTQERVTPIEIDDNGTIRVFYNTLDTNGEREYDEWEQVFRWIDTKHTNGIHISDDGTVTVYYNTFHEEPDPEDPDKTVSVRDKTVFYNVLDWITNVSLSQEGDFEVLFNNVTIQGGRYYQKLHWIDLIDVSSDGVISFYYNDDHDVPIYQAFDRIKYLSNIEIQNVDPTIENPTAADEGSGDQRLHVEYNTGESEILGKPLNYIIETVICKPIASHPDAPYSHLLVYYADPALRQSLSSKWVTYPSEKYPGVERTEWVDLGDVRGAAGGLHIIEDIDDLSILEDPQTGLAIPPEKLTDSTGTIIQPDGAGWGVTYTPEGATYSMIYCYDYNGKRWYSIGQIDPSAVEPDSVIVKSAPVGDTGLPDPVDIALLKEKGFWLASETMYFAQ